MPKLFSRSILVLCVASVSVLAFVQTPSRAAAKRKGAGLTPSLRAGIPPEAFGSPVPSPDSSRWVWIADLGQGPNLYVGTADRKTKTQLTKYVFTPTNDLMPGLPVLWSPDGRNVAYFEYSHRAASPLTSSKAVLISTDGNGAPRRIRRPGSDLNTRPQRWLDASALRFKGLREASTAAPEDPYVYVLGADTCGSEASYLAAVREQADSAAARAARAMPATPAPGTVKSH